MNLLRPRAVFLTPLFGLAFAAGATAESVRQPEPTLVFLLIGQSNMAGRGKVEDVDKVIHARVWMLTKERVWAPATNPMHFDKPAIAGVGLGVTFGRVVAETRPGEVIGLVPAAFGGTSLDQWQPGEALYEEAVARARVALRTGRLGGILWHQGEADRAPEKTATYARRFQAMIQRLRADLGAGDVPVIVGELGRFLPENAEINAVLAALPGTVPNSACVDSEGLGHGGDSTHFDSPALRTFGERYARAWLKLAPTPPAPTRS